jgi:dTDP-4-amino-4,6-dideoxygalactose transaminase
MNIVGYNFRLGEIESAIGTAQLKKVDHLLQRKRQIADALTQGLCDLPGLQTPVLRESCTHSYYMYPLVLDINRLCVRREQIYNALRAEGVTCLSVGYQNIHLLPMYQKKIAYGNSGFPWSSDVCRREVSYAKGICPVAEELHAVSHMNILLCAYDFSDEDIDLIIRAFKKVWSNLGSIH